MEKKSELTLEEALKLAKNVRSWVEVRESRVNAKGLVPVGGIGTKYIGLSHGLRVEVFSEDVDDGIYLCVVCGNTGDLGLYGGGRNSRIAKLYRSAQERYQSMINPNETEEEAVERVRTQLRE